MVHSASVGVDCYPRWLLDAPLVTCGRGVAPEEIADYVIAAVYLHTKDLERVRAQPAGVEAGAAGAWCGQNGRHYRPGRDRHGGPWRSACK